jgi:hypothetical protein
MHYLVVFERLRADPSRFGVSGMGFGFWNLGYGIGTMLRAEDK